MKIFNRTYKYFVSYSYQKNNTHGFSNCIITTNKIKTIEQLDKVANEIGSNNDKGRVVILNYRKV